MNDMTALHFSDRPHHSAYIPVIWFAALFAVITYVAISMRAILSPYEVHYFVDAKRLFSVAVGTFVLWLSIRAADKVSEDGPGAQIFAVLNIAIPGAIGLLVAREAYDLAASGEFAQRFALNLRWMLTWIGYFAAAVAGFLAVSYFRQLQSVTAHGAQTKTATYAEIADGKDSNEIKTLLMVLRAQTGYESADIEIGRDASVKEERLATINRLLDRLETKKRV
jgi:hypothetical protein